MRHLALLTCLWPGVPQLWLRGSGTGLLVALMFCVVGNALLMSSLGPFAFLGTPAAMLGWTVWAVGWVAALGWTLTDHFRRYEAPTQVNQVDEQALINAQHAYLAGHWDQAESLVKHILNTDPDDREARLMLATVLRRTGRFDGARRQLNRLEKTDLSGNWIHEIEQERQLIVERVALEREESPDDSVPAVDDRTTEPTAPISNESSKQAA